jgi:hypothetical protein
MEFIMNYGETTQRQRKRKHSSDIEEKKRIHEEQKLQKKRIREQIKEEKKEQKKEQILIKKEQKIEEKYELTAKAITRIIMIAEILFIKFPAGFKINHFTNEYIENFGRLNPFTSEIMDEEYDIHAAIRSIVYECSPSSLQHWFKYGISKNIFQIAPWLFYNKELAEFNNNGCWKMVKARTIEEKNNKYEHGLWKILPRGNFTQYFWDNEIYGPKPTLTQLRKARVGRLIGVRGSKKNDNDV